MNRLEGKVAIITGGNSGVGAATALLFAQEGAKVIITARRKEKLKEVANQIESIGGTVLPISADISKHEDVQRVMEETIAAFGQVDILVNNAGILEAGLKPIDRFEESDLDRILNTNTKGTMYCMKEACLTMEKTGKGSIINVASVAGVFGCGGAAYVSSKSAVIGVTKHTALRFAGTGIRCNVVCPSTIVTPMVMQTDPATLDRDMMGQMAKHADLKVQPCLPQDVANVLLFLASDESRSITGQTLVCDFGSTL